MRTRFYDLFHDLERDGVASQSSAILFDFDPDICTQDLSSWSVVYIPPLRDSSLIHIPLHLGTD